MIEARKQQILSTLTALRKERYSNKDKLQEAIDFEHELYRAAFDGMCVDKPRFSDVINRLMELDTQAGGIVTDKIYLLKSCALRIHQQGKWISPLQEVQASHSIGRSCLLRFHQLVCQVP